MRVDEGRLGFSYDWVISRVTLFTSLVLFGGQDCFQSILVSHSHNQELFIHRSVLSWYSLNYCGGSIIVRKMLHICHGFKIDCCTLICIGFCSSKLEVVLLAKCLIEHSKRWVVVNMMSKNWLLHIWFVHKALLDGNHTLFDLLDLVWFHCWEWGHFWTGWAKSTCLSLRGLCSTSHVKYCAHVLISFDYWRPVRIPTCGVFL